MYFWKSAFFSGLLVMANFVLAEWNWQQIGLKGVKVTSLCYTEHGLYVGTAGKGVFSWENEFFYPCEGSPNIDTLTVYSISVRDEENIYAGTDHGLFRYTDIQKWQGWLQIHAIPDCPVRSILLSNDTTLFVTAGDVYRCSNIINYTLWEPLQARSCLDATEAPLFYCLEKFGENIAVGSIDNGMKKHWGAYWDHGIMETTGLTGVLE